MKQTILFALIMTSSVLFAQTKKTKKLFNKAQEYTAKKDYSNSIKTYLKAIEIDSSQYAFYLNIGINYFEIGEYDLSISNLQKAKKINPKDYKVYMSLGNSYSNKREFDPAVQNLKQAVILKESEWDTLYYNIGNNFMRWNKLDSAVLYYTKGLELSPKSSMIRTNLAYVFILKEDYLNAKGQLETLIKVSPEIANNYNNLGFVLYKLDELDKAEEYVNQSIKIDKNNSWTYRNLGLIYMKKGDTKKACKNLDKALNLDFVKVWGEEDIKELIDYCK